VDRKNQLTVFHFDGKSVDLCRRNEVVLREPANCVFDLLLRYASSEDGALHAEKYYRTVTEEFA